MECRGWVKSCHGLYKEPQDSNPPVPGMEVVHDSLEELRALGYMGEPFWLCGLGFMAYVFHRDGCGGHAGLGDPSADWSIV